jgi:hypothetical protein
MNRLNNRLDKTLLERVFTFPLLAFLVHVKKERFIKLRTDEFFPYFL